MRRYYIFIISIIGLMLIVGCSERNIPTFGDLSNVDLISIVREEKGRERKEEKEISFDLLSASIVDTSFTITARLSGSAVNRDRTINIVATDSTTATEGEHYTLTDCVIPANKVETKFKLNLIRPKGLVEGDSLIVKLKVIKSENLTPGIDNALRFKILIGLPNKWPYSFAKYFFGSYSKVKFKFLIDLYGSAKAVNDAIRSWKWDAHAFYAYKALQDYKESHGGKPLMDENGEEVTIPGYE